jgi:exodeoxyribonuclease V gamma subunit
MVRQYGGGSDTARLLAHLRAAGVLPPGTVGECLYDELRHGAERLVAEVNALTGGSAPEPLDVEFRLAGFTLKGRLSNVHAQGAIQVRHARIRGGDLLRGWISHLALHLAGPPEIPRVTYLVGLSQEKGRLPEAETLRLGPVGEPGDLLIRLLKRYWAGLITPLPLFPESSLSYARDVSIKGKDPQQSLHRARGIWEGNEQGRGECEDLSYRLCYGGGDPLDENFEEVSKEVFGPLLAHLERSHG